MHQRVDQNQPMIHKNWCTLPLNTNSPGKFYMECTSNSHTAAAAAAILAFGLTLLTGIKPQNIHGVVSLTPQQ